MDDGQQSTNNVIHNNIKCTKSNINSLLERIDKNEHLTNIEKEYYKEILNFGIIATNGRSTEQKIQDLTEQLANINKYIIENNLEIKNIEAKFQNAFNNIRELTINDNVKIHEKLSQEVEKLCDMLVKHTDHIRDSIYEKMDKEHSSIRTEKDNNLATNRNEHIEIQKNILNIVSQRFSENKIESEQRFKSLEQSNDARFERVYDKIDKLSNTLAVHKSDIQKINENLEFLVKQNINKSKHHRNVIQDETIMNNDTPKKQDIEDSEQLNTIDIINVLDTKKNVLKEASKLLIEYKWPFTMIIMIILWLAYNSEHFANIIISLFK